MYEFCFYSVSIRPVPFVPSLVDFRKHLTLSKESRNGVQVRNEDLELWKVSSVTVEQ